VVAALLHDTIEDCDINGEHLTQLFNETVTQLVEGVTKLNIIADNSIERYTELLNLRKFLISSSADIRILLIKLADRLHNMRTIDALKPERQIEYSDETLKVYVPLAEYIGIGKWKRELEDIAFRKREPEVYNKVKEEIEQHKSIHEAFLAQSIEELTAILQAYGIKGFKIYGRIKSVHSTYRKLLKQSVEGRDVINDESIDISRIKDFIATSIVLDSDEIDCYRVLGLVHAHFEHSTKDFTDYIAKPKTNGYRSIHTLIYFKESTVEIQIKTAQMHEVNEFGPASHLAYKLSGKKFAQATDKYSWIKNLNSWNKKDNSDLNKYEITAFSDKIFVITPKGRVIELDKGSTPIDFAYRIHSEVGNRYTGARVNDQIVKIDYQLQSGDVVDILTSKNPKKPSLEWVQAAYSSSTKQKIKRMLTIHQNDENIQKGKGLIADYIYEHSKIDWLTLDSSMLKFIINEFGSKDLDHFYTDIYLQKVAKKEILKKLIKKLNIPLDSLTPSRVVKNHNETRSTTDVLIEGIGDLEYKIAGCCKPIKGDEIVGIITFKDGLKIHRKVCPHLEGLDQERLLEATWLKSKKD
jgi:GTP pyrophosphokinase